MPSSKFSACTKLFHIIGYAFDHRLPNSKGIGLFPRKGIWREKLKEKNQWWSHTQGWEPKAPQNLKKSFYSMYIIYILKNVVCKN